MKAIESLQVAVLGGGPGSEREVSLASSRAVVEALTGRVGSVTFVDVRDRHFLVPEGTDVAFNAIHGTFGEDGGLQEELDRRGLPYTGARRASSRLAFDKIDSKKRFAETGVSSPEWEVIDLSGELSRIDPWRVPCVIKPPREGSSVGVHIVREATEWLPALIDLKRFGKDALVEDFVSGKELTVGIVGDLALPVIHIQPRSGFYDMSNKYPWLSNQGGTDYFCPADLPTEVAAEVQRQALAAHQALGVEVYSRVDVLLDGELRPWVLEVNTIPGMTASSLLPKAARAVGLDFSDLCVKIIELSLII